MIDRDYYIGLDMGTSSVGWAVTDENYNLIRAKGKDLWGVRLFPEADTSASRRSFRTSRRRRAREKARIGYLRELFADEINAIDPGFYQRLDDSKFHKEDKHEMQPFALFADKGYTDADYFRDYPTIFHLRKALATDDNCAADVRMVFLAILNIFRHRGHFLNQNLSGNSIGDVSELLTELSVALEAYNGTILPSNIQTSIEEILPSKDYSNKKRHELLLSNLGIDKKQKALAELMKLPCGLTAKMTIVFPDESFDEEYEKFSISFKDGNYDEKELTAEQILSEQAFDIISILKSVYEWGILSNMMGGSGKTYRYISEARVAMYEKHRADLKCLKSYIKAYAPDSYDALFREMGKDSYSAYVGSVNSDKVKARRTENANAQGLFENLTKLLKNTSDNEEKAYILNEIEKDTFLPKQMTSANGVIPYQLHLAELQAILKNAEKKLEFLQEVDDSGLSVSKRIIEIFKFQIPYYIGPLVNNASENTWVKRIASGKVYPWNFNEKIDEAASAEAFISRMVKHCTYLSGETVLPKNSLLYEKFMVLNELNNLRINGEKISVELKQSIFKDLFRRGKKVKIARLESYLKSNGHVGVNDSVEITGIDGDFTNTLSNYSKFTAIFDVDVLNFEQEQIAENIIFWSTVYGDSKQFLEQKIISAYGDKLNDGQIRRILGIKFKEWGRLSKEFLKTESQTPDPITGEFRTIIGCLWDTNDNLMQLLGANYDFAKAIEAKCKTVEKSLMEFEYEDLDGMYMSAPVKRMTWQTILILKELIGVLGREPKRIFVEMAKGPDDSGRKASRKNKLAALYKGCKDDGKNWVQEIKGKEESSFKSKKLYLYYLQKGRCMYTGEVIDLDNLFNDNLYDIDHIYPRHFTKDDSIENNLVLVKKEKNAHKSDTYPIEQTIRTTQSGWWRILRDGGFINAEKYARLTRNEAFTAEERAAFISRQIVETRQGTKLITTLLENASEKTEIVYVKAGNVSAFRQKFDLIKNRNINNLHHAKDAYLNIVVGNTYYVKFTKNPLNFVKDYLVNPSKNEYHMYKLFEYNVMRNDEIAWSIEGNKSISIVKRVMGRNTPLVTRMNYEAHGGIADQQIRKATEADKAGGVGYLPIKSRDERLHNVAKYGGYRKYTGAYFFLVEHTEKKKRIRTIEAMPLYLKDNLDTVEKMEEYCREQLGYVDPSIRMPKIKMYSKLKVNGFPLYLTGRSNNRLTVLSAVELILAHEYCKYLKTPSLVTDGDVDNRKSMNCKIYDVLTDKYSAGIFANRPNPIGDKLIAGKNKFSDLEEETQFALIEQIIGLSNSNAGADMSALGEAKKTGVTMINKRISENDSILLCNESITGLFTSTVDLLTI